MRFECVSAYKIHVLVSTHKCLVVRLEYHTPLKIQKQAPEHARKYLPCSPLFVTRTSLYRTCRRTTALMSMFACLQGLLQPGGTARHGAGPLVGSRSSALRGNACGSQVPVVSMQQCMHAAAGSFGGMARPRCVDNMCRQPV